MSHKISLVAALVAIPLLFPAQAEAGERCKQYTKTIRINGELEIGYGRACQYDDGYWRIVKLSGPHKARERARERIYDDLYDELYHEPHRYTKKVVSYSKPYRYYHAYDHGHYKRAKKHYKKHKKYHRKHHAHHYDCHD